jgi:YHS domain-containing protein
MEVSEEGAKFRSRSGGKTVYFCCPHCKSKFDQNPQGYKTI